MAGTLARDSAIRANSGHGDILRRSLLLWLSYAIPLVDGRVLPPI